MSAYEGLLVAPEPRAEVREGLRALEKELAERRVTGSSPDGTVTATVTGDGLLVDLVITDQALRGSHPETVGPSIVAAVRNARVDAGRHAREAMRFVIRSPSSPGPPSPPAVRASRPKPTEDDGDLFQGFRR